MLRIAICDDMPASLARAEELIFHWQKSISAPVSVECFTEAESLIQSHGKKPFDILLLDIVMPLTNGIHAASEIRKTDKLVKIVFLTSSAEFAVESYTVHANGYLLKPVEAEPFFTCLNELYTDLSALSQSILIKDSAAVRRIPLREIEFAEAQGKHVRFVLSDGSILTSLHSFHAYEELLTAQDGFLKCHRSYIVNIFCIHKYTAKEITMKSGFSIPVSRNCHKDFEAAFFDLTFRKVGDT